MLTRGATRCRHFHGPRQMPTRARRAPRHWLLKSEPSDFSFQDLLASPDRSTCWDGVRNYQARNLLREMRSGDLVFFYHSSADPPAIVGVAEVVKDAYPDHTAFDRRHPHYDPKSREEEPTWWMVDVRARAPIHPPITLAELRDTTGLEAMELLRRGSRLSVQPVGAREWARILRLRSGGAAASGGRRRPSTRTAGE